MRWCVTVSVTVAGLLVAQGCRSEKDSTSPNPASPMPATRSSGTVPSTNPAERVGKARQQQARAREGRRNRQQQRKPDAARNNNARQQKQDPRRQPVGATNDAGVKPANSTMRGVVPVSDKHPANAGDADILTAPPAGAELRETYYPSGALERRCYVVRDAQGREVKQGQEMTYQQTGQKWREVNYRDGIEHGRSRVWNQDGTIVGGLDFEFENGRRKTPLINPPAPGGG